MIDYLLCDDDKSFRSRLAKALQDRSYRVAEAANISEARAFLNDKPVQRMVIDLKMPGGDGMTLIEELSDQHLDTDIVVLTGYGSIATATKAIKLGATNYLSKPVSVEQIISAFSDSAAQTATHVASLEQVEWEHIQRVLLDQGGNVSQAAKILGVHRRSLQRKLQKPPAPVQRTPRGA